MRTVWMFPEVGLGCQLRLDQVGGQRPRCFRGRVVLPEVGGIPDRLRQSASGGTSAKVAAIFRGLVPPAALIILPPCRKKPVPNALIRIHSFLPCLRHTDPKRHF